MPFMTKRSVLAVCVVAGVATLAATGFVWSGVYNIGADDPHTPPVYAALQALRLRSIDTRAHKLQVPADVDAPARIRQGAGNYDAMCTGCHLAPGMEETELSKGLYPSPPQLAKVSIDTAEAFWAIKHGIKASGMPAWGKSMDDEYIWNMAAFLQELPKLDAEQYKALVASSGGHSHGGGETGSHAHEGMPDHDHDHPEGEGDHHHEEADAGAIASPPPQGTTHVHSDGTRHIHPPKTNATSQTSPEPMPTKQPPNEPEPGAEEHHEHHH